MGHILLHRRTRVGADRAAPDLEICPGVGGRGTASPDSGVSLALKHLNKVRLQPIGSQRLMQIEEWPALVNRAVQMK